MRRGSERSAPAASRPLGSRSACCTEGKGWSVFSQGITSNARTSPETLVFVRRRSQPEQLLLVAVARNRIHSRDHEYARMRLKIDDVDVEALLTREARARLPLTRQLRLY